MEIIYYVLCQLLECCFRCRKRREEDMKMEMNRGCSRCLPNTRALMWSTQIGRTLITPFIWNYRNVQENRKMWFEISFAKFNLLWICKSTGIWRKYRFYVSSAILWCSLFYSDVPPYSPYSSESNNNATNMPKPMDTDTAKSNTIAEDINSSTTQM